MTTAAQSGVAPASGLQPPASIDPEGERVWTWLQHRRGRDSAITAGEMAEILGWGGGVEVRECITRNLDLFPGPVVADPAVGFFVAVTPEEMEEYDAQLHRRGVLILVRLRRFRQHAAACGFARQGRRYFKVAPAAPPGQLFEA